jgi:hypothetical protein
MLKYNETIVKFATISEVQRFKLLVLTSVCLYDGAHAAFTCSLHSHNKVVTTAK